MNRLFAINATHLTVNKTYTQMACNVERFPTLSIVAETTGGSTASYIAIGC